MAPRWTDVIRVTAVDVLALLINEGSWEAAADIARWQNWHNETASPLTVLKFATINRGVPDVVLALTLGMIRRAHKNTDGSFGTRPHDYVCVHEGATILNTRTPVVCAALAIWLMSHSGTESNFMAQTSAYIYGGAARIRARSRLVYVRCTDRRRSYRRVVYALNSSSWLIRRCPSGGASGNWSTSRPHFYGYI